MRERENERENEREREKKKTIKSLHILIRFVTVKAFGEVVIISLTPHFHL